MSIQNLHKLQQCQLLLALQHDELIPFIREELRSNTWTMRFFFAAVILSLATLAWVSWQSIENEGESWDFVLKNIGLGTLLVFSVGIPLHEGLHGLAYKMIGAPRITYGVNWRMLYFYAAADGFIVSRKGFIFVALLPFLVVSLTCIPVIFFIQPELKTLLASVLFWHTSACAGDLALMSFYEKNRRFSQMLTFDDVEKNIIYFYVKDV